MMKSKKEMSVDSNINWLSDVKSYIDAALKRCESFNKDNSELELKDIINWLDIAKESIIFLIDNVEKKEIKPCQFEQRRNVSRSFSQCIVIGDIITVNGQKFTVSGIGKSTISISKLIKEEI